MLVLDTKSSPLSGPRYQLSNTRSCLSHVKDFNKLVSTSKSDFVYKPKLIIMIFSLLLLLRRGGTARKKRLAASQYLLLDNKPVICIFELEKEIARGLVGSFG